MVGNGVEEAADHPVPDRNVRAALQNLVPRGTKFCDWRSLREDDCVLLENFKEGRNAVRVRGVFRPGGPRRWDVPPPNLPCPKKECLTWVLRINK